MPPACLDVSLRRNAPWSPSTLSSPFMQIATGLDRRSGDSGAQRFGGEQPATEPAGKPRHGTGGQAPAQNRRASPATADGLRVSRPGSGLAGARYTSGGEGCGRDRGRPLRGLLELTPRPLSQKSLDGSFPCPCPFPCHGPDPENVPSHDRLRWVFGAPSGTGTGTGTGTNSEASFGLITLGPRRIPRPRHIGHRQITSLGRAPKTTIPPSITKGRT